MWTRGAVEPELQTWRESVYVLIPSDQCKEDSRISHGSSERVWTKREGTVLTNVNLKRFGIGHCSQRRSNEEWEIHVDVAIAT